VLERLRPCGAVDEDVVEEDEDEAAQDLVHERLECRRGVGEPKCHDQELEVAMVCMERRLGDVLVVHPNLVVANAEVELGEEAGAV
jgi:hypothetical protein